MESGIFKELKAYGESDYYPFHMPGHKRNPDSGPLSEAYRFDITEIDGFDNLHQPEGMIAKAQKRAAGLYHSRETYFLVNGSTAGILSAVSAVAGRGKKLIMARNCHKSVYHGVFLNHLEPEYIYPELVEGFGISGGVTAEQVEKKLEEIAEKEGICIEQTGSVTAGVLITSPTYDGILSDVAGIVKTAHRYGIPVIVDQAHGAHFGFHPAFPENAVTQGADLVIHSVHKTLPAPTQTALLHCNGSLVNSENVRKYLRIYQSSSPSYLLIAGIDSCMEIMEREGRERLEKLLSYRRRLIKETEGLKNIRLYPSMAEKHKTEKRMDTAFETGTEEPGKLLIFVRGAEFAGRQLYELLREKYHLQMEMYASDYVTAILSLMDRKEGFERLAAALTEADGLLTQQKEVRWTEKGEEDDFFCQQYQPVTVLPLEEAYMAGSCYELLENGEGRTAADFVDLYPPGIPILAPGERIDNKVIQLIRRYLDHGYTVQGVVSKKGDTGGCYLKVME